MKTTETTIRTETKSLETAIDVLDCLDTLKTQISNVLQSERKRRCMKKKDFIRLLGVSFPTFKKLINDPHSQSLTTIERVFRQLSRHDSDRVSGKTPRQSAIRGGFMMQDMQKVCNAPVTATVLYSHTRMGMTQCG